MVRSLAAGSLVMVTGCGDGFADRAEHVEVARSDHLVFFATTTARDQLDPDRYAELTEPDAAEVSSLAGVPDVAATEVYLYFEAGCESSPTGYCAGVTRPDGTIDLFMDEDGISDASFQSTLRHEYGHVVSDLRGGPCLRLLLDEGVAEYLARGSTSASTATASDEVPGTVLDDLGRALHDREFLPLQDLVSSGDFARLRRPDHQPVYAESAAFVELVWERLGPTGFFSFYEEACMGDDVHFARALDDATGSTLATFEAELLASL